MEAQHRRLNLYFSCRIFIPQAKRIYFRSGKELPETETLIPPHNADKTGIRCCSRRRACRRRRYERTEKEIVRARRRCIQEGNWISHISRTQHAQRTPSLISRDSHGSGYYLELFSRTRLQCAATVSLAISSPRPGVTRGRDNEPFINTAFRCGK